MIKVIIFSDIKLYCEGLNRILSDTNPIEIIATESNFTDVVTKIKKHLPDVILLDITMTDSRRIAQEMMRLFPDASIVALAVAEDDENIVECAGTGIAGYVARGASLDDLVDTITRVNEGEFCCPPKIAAYIFNKIHHLVSGTWGNNLTDTHRDSENLLTGLTRREQQIMELVAAGLSNKLISRELNIEVSTVKNHVHNILVKLNVKSRTGAVSLLRRSSFSSDAYRSLDKAGNFLP